MKRKYAIAILASIIIFCFCLTSCGQKLSGNNTQTNTQTTDNSKQDMVDINDTKMNDLLKHQCLYVENEHRFVQNETNKLLYPDVITCNVKNNSGKEVKTVEVKFVAWDKNNFPIKIITQFDSSGGYYIKGMLVDDANIPVDGIWDGSEYGLFLSEETGDKLGALKACVYQVHYFDGTTWDNPLMPLFEKYYSNQKLDQTHAIQIKQSEYNSLLTNAKSE